MPTDQRLPDSTLLYLDSRGETSKLTPEELDRLNKLKNVGPEPTPAAPPPPPEPLLGATEQDQIAPAKARKDDGLELFLGKAGEVLGKPVDAAAGLIESIGSDRWGRAPKDAHQKAVEAVGAGVEMTAALAGIVRNLLTPGTPEQTFALRAIVPGTRESGVAGQAIVDAVKEEWEFAKKLYDDPRGTAAEDPIRTLEFAANVALVGAGTYKAAKHVAAFLEREGARAALDVAQKEATAQWLNQANALKGSALETTQQAMSDTEALAAVYNRALAPVDEIRKMGEVRRPADYMLWKQPLNKHLDRFVIRKSDSTDEVFRVMDDAGDMVEIRGLTERQRVTNEWVRSTQDAVDMGLISESRATELAGGEHTFVKAERGFGELVKMKDPVTGKPVSIPGAKNDPEIIDLFRIETSKPPPPQTYSGVKLRGKLGRWFREAGPSGADLYHLDQQLTARTNVMVRWLDEQTKRTWFALTEEQRAKVKWTSLGSIKVNGKWEHGGMVRGLEIEVPKNLKGDDLAEWLHQHRPGTILKDGRVTGESVENKIKTYYPVWSDDAEAAFNELRKTDPEAFKLLEALRAEEEIPMLLPTGDVAPPFSLTVASERYGLTIGTQQEIDAGKAAIVKAHGKDAERMRVWRFNYVPESYQEDRIFKQFSNRFRNALRPFRPAPTKFKSGSAFQSSLEAELAGATDPVDIAKSHLKNRQELFAKKLHDELMERIFLTVAEPMVPGETAAMAEAAGYMPISKAGLEGLAGDYVSLKQWLFRNQAFLERLGFPKDSKALDALVKAGGKGYKIPKQLFEDIAGVKSVKSTNATYQAIQDGLKVVAADLIRAPMVQLLTAPATAMRNLWSQLSTAAPRVIEDALYGAMRVADDVKMGTFAKTSIGDAFNPFVSDLKLFKGFPKHVRGRMPPEMFGHTFFDELLSGNVGWYSKLSGKALKGTGFQYIDVQTKRSLYAASIEASANQAWRDAVANGATRGLTKEQYIAKFKSGIPEEIAVQAYYDMERFGGFDYGNTNKGIDWFRKHTVTRAAVPFITFPYKHANYYLEFFGADTWATAVGTKSRAAFGKVFGDAFPITSATMRGGATRDQILRARAKLAAGTFMAAAAWYMLDDDGEPVDELTDPAMVDLIKKGKEIGIEGPNEGDLPFEVQQRGRIHFETVDELLGAKKNRDIWWRILEIPWIGPAAFIKHAKRGEMTFSEFINDTIAMGPLIQMADVLRDVTNDYNKHLPAGARIARAADPLLPFPQQRRLARRLIDPNKREIDAEAGFVDGFFQQVADNFPVSSYILPERYRPSRHDLPIYKPSESVASFFLWNARGMDDEDREYFIAQTALERLQDARARVSRRVYAEAAKKTADKLGETRAGKAIQIAEMLEDEARQEYIKGYVNYVANHAYLGNDGSEGGFKAAATAALGAVVDWVDDGHVVDDGVARSFRATLRQLGILEIGGYDLYVLDKIPKNMRVKYMMVLEELKKENQFLRTPEELQNEPKRLLAVPDVFKEEGSE